MEFTFETVYDQKALTAMARALRKTVRRSRSKRSHILGMIVVVLAVLLFFAADEMTVSKAILTWSAAAAIIFVLIWEDSLNGYVARKRGLPGLDKAHVTFHEDGYHSATAIGESDFRYDTILRFAETKDYFVLIFSASHAQVYDKHSLTGGSCEEFAQFITEKTGKQLESV